MYTGYLDYMHMAITETWLKANFNKVRDKVEEFADRDAMSVVEAKKHLGLKENTSKTVHNPTILNWLKSHGSWWQEDETPWCGTFVAWCLKTAGVAYPKHWYHALDYVNYGSKTAYGCVAIKTRSGGGHVCFVAGRDSKTGKLVCMGGNQSNMVCYALYNEADPSPQPF